MADHLDADAALAAALQAEEDALAAAATEALASARDAAGELVGQVAYGRHLAEQVYRRER